jgi:hypothetical protein
VRFRLLKEAYDRASIALLRKQGSSSKVPHQSQSQEPDNSCDNATMGMEQHMYYGLATVMSSCPIRAGKVSFHSSVTSLQVGTVQAVRTTSSTCVDFEGHFSDQILRIARGSSQETTG